MKRIYLLLLIASTVLFYSCGARKAETKKEENKTNLNIVSKEEEKAENTTNVEIKSAITTSENGTIKTTTTTVTPIDNTKPAEFVDKHGRKLKIDNSKYVEEEKEEIVSKNKLDNTVTKVNKLDKNSTSKNIEYSSKSASKNKEKLVEKESSFEWYLLFIPVILLAAGYAYYKATPVSNLLKIFKNT